MANRKISDLTALTAPAVDDLLPIVDISEAAAADKNKKITYGTFLSSVPLGTAALPGIAVSGDLNTGIYSPGADQLAISTGGTGRLFVDASGNIDIAGNATVSNASAVLKVNGTSGSPQLLFQRAGANSSQLTDVGASGLLLQTIAGNPLSFGTNATERLRITSAGLVGINTTSPGRLLQVSNTSSDPFISILGAASNEGGLLFGDNASDAAGQIRYQHSVDAMHFVTNSTERARIDSSGRLLVGTSTSPSAGEGQYARIVAQGYTGGATGGGYISLQRGEAAAAITTEEELGLINFGDSSGNTFATISCRADAAAGAGDYPGRLVLSTTANGASSPTERMRITSDAYVRLASGTGGIQFNGDTAAANALDDYEEGTWTPVITGSTTAGTVGYDNQVGKFTKTGRQVTVSCICDTGLVTAAPTGNIRVSGLPFASSASHEFVGAADLKGIPFPASTTYVVVEGVSGQTYVEFFAGGNNVNTATVQADSLANDDYIRFTLTYFV